MVDACFWELKASCQLKELEVAQVHFFLIYDELLKNLQHDRSINFKQTICDHPLKVRVHFGMERHIGVKVPGFRIKGACD